MNVFRLEKITYRPPKRRDDSYMAYLCRGSHDHLMVWQVFPAWGKIATRVRERLAKTKKWHDDQDAAYVAELNPTDPVSDPAKLRAVLAVGV